MRLGSAARLGVVGLVAATVWPAMAENAAHELANKFAGGARMEAVSGDDAVRDAYEVDMLERARREAAEQVLPDNDLPSDDEMSQRALEAQREAESRALADRLKRAQEARREKAADAAEEELREKPFKPALTNKDKEVKPEADTAKAPIIVTPPKENPETATPPQVFARDPELAPPMALGRPAPLPPSVNAQVDMRVTILLVMEPGKKGIRRFNKTADPVVCEQHICFVSNGPAQPARAMPMRKALGPGNTFGKRAGACRGKLSCVFRGLTLDASSAIQPVDLKVLVHDRRERRVISGDASCQVLAGRLSCGRTVVAPGYRAWVVPEAVANEAGPQALEAAVTRGLVANPVREASAGP
jgi:hypothetical protein